MDNRISSETSKPVQATQPSTQKPKLSPTKLLGLVTGARAKAEKTGESVQKSVKRLSSMLEEAGTTAGAEGLEPPKLPAKSEVPEKKGLFDSIRDLGRNANMELDRRRWEAVARGNTFLALGSLELVVSDLSVRAD